MLIQIHVVNLPGWRPKISIDPLRADLYNAIRAPDALHADYGVLTTL